MEQPDSPTQALSERDPFWDVREHEAAEERELEKQIDSLSAAIDLGRRALQIRNAPGFQGFLEAVTDLRDVAVRKLARDNKLTDAGMREQRGCVQALEDVLSLLTSEQMVDLLEAQRQSRQNTLEGALRRRPKPREDTP